MCGQCPKCKSLDLDYGGMNFVDGEQIYYNFSCNHCGAEGKEWYITKFVETQLDESIKINRWEMK